VTTIEQALADLDELKACCKTDEARAAKLEHGIVESALLAAESLDAWLVADVFDHKPEATVRLVNAIERAQKTAKIALDARQVMCRRFDK
jgi:hypothetical protein